jgi:hypothetical protein
LSALVLVVLVVLVVELVVSFSGILSNIFITLRNLRNLCLISFHS